MNKEQVITDEKISEFIRNNNSASVREVIKAWEEFKNQPPQQEWEVVEIIFKDGTPIFWKDLKDLWLSNLYWAEKSIEVGHKIQKVRRLSDSAVLEVGVSSLIKDDMREGENISTPDAIEYRGADLFVRFKEEPVFTIIITSISSIKECRPVLFVTSDGKEICKGDEFWSAFDTSRQSFATGKIPLFTTFSTKELADNHLYWNKKDKSLAMIREALVAQGFEIDSASDLIEEIERGLEKTKYS